jgi:hypothetical protein
VNYGIRNTNIKLTKIPIFFLGVEDIAFSILQGGQQRQEPEVVPLTKKLPGISGLEIL